MVRLSNAKRAFYLVFLSFAFTACDGDPASEDAGVEENDASMTPDAGPRDAGGQMDADAGTPDAGGPACEGPPGLYSDGDCTELAEGVRPFRPAYPLWTDAADKTRFIFLPEGEQIDTSDPDNWRFPVGTRLYKTFARGDLWLETRVMEKISAGVGQATWTFRAYAWNAERTAVREVTEEDESVRHNVLGTTHDIPARFECNRCHGGSAANVLGFSAIQLNHGGDGVTLDALNTAGTLTDGIETGAAVMPGNATERAGLGVLHANCGHCHREGAPDEIIVRGLFMWTHVADETLSDTDVAQSAIGEMSLYFDEASNCRIDPGHPDSSLIMRRMRSRTIPFQMPPIGTEEVDTEGVAAVTAFIGGLSDERPASCVP